MTERDLLQQLFLLRCDIESCPMLDEFAAQQRVRWAARLGDLLNRRNATRGKETQRAEVLENAIRSHRDARGDDRCWMDDEELYRALPEGYTPPARDTAVELHLCERFILNRHNPHTRYTSPQRRIEELETELQRYRSQGE